MAKRAGNPDKAAAERDSLLTSVGERILDARRRAKFSQEQLAEKAGLTHSSIFQAENGLQNLTLKSLDQLARALGIEIKALLPGTDLASDPDPTSRVARGLVEELGRAVMLTKRLEELAAILEARVSRERTPPKE